MIQTNNDRLPFASVIVPVYNDLDRLVICLGSLENQIYPRDSYEVIVVDNGSDIDIEAVTSEFHHVRNIAELTPGSFAARNAGIAIAKGDVFAFTDSDCIPASDWLKNGVESLGLGIGLVGGKVDIFVEDPAHLTAVDLHEIICGFPQERFIKKYKWSVSANLFTTRKVLQKVGVFNPVLKSGGDKEWGQRVFESGYRQVYSADARVQHPSRRTLAALLKQGIRTTGGHFQQERANGRGQISVIFDGIRLFFACPKWIRLYDEHPLLNARGNRLKCSAVKYLLSVVFICELCRLALGGSPTRS